MPHKLPTKAERREYLRRRGWMSHGPNTWHLPTETWHIYSLAAAWRTEMDYWR